MPPSDLSPNLFFGQFLSPEALVKAHYEEVLNIPQDAHIYRTLNFVKEHHLLTTGPDPFYYRTPDARYYVVM